MTRDPVADMAKLIAVAGLALAALFVLDACGDDDPAGGAADAAPPAQPYTLPLFDARRIESHGELADFQKISAPLDFHDGPFTSVKLVVDLSSTCYPFEGWQANPPPAGHNWPADCDAFDRNFEISLDEPAAESDPPAFEIVHAITPFGGPLHLETDLTDLANARPGSHTLQAYIATWSDGAGQVSGSNGGWTVSAHLEVVPGPAPRRVLAAIPLVRRSQGKADVPPVASFTVPEGTVSTRLEYRVSGHGGAQDQAGGCIGPADEFCQRMHHVLVDGAELQAMVPWRTDCPSLCTVTHYGAPGSGFDYCLENPCGAIQSVRAPRANWCPGDETPAFTWDPPALHAPGEHTFTYAIDGIAEGGVWSVSAIFYAYGP